MELRPPTGTAVINPEPPAEPEPSDPGQEEEPPREPEKVPGPDREPERELEPVGASVSGLKSPGT
ncbi:MAG: hypothetical protein ACE5Q6_21570 [Dehalococcoidia bacterium]